DLAVVRHMSDRVAVMYLGAPVELAPKKQGFAAPKHPYTQALMAANPSAGVGKRKKRALLGGDVPSPIKPPPGCRFHPRCPHAVERCRTERPEAKNIGTAEEPYLVACHLVTSMNDYPRYT